MTYYYYWNPKYFDAGSVLRNQHPEWLKKKKKGKKVPEFHTKELREKVEEFIEISPKIEEIKREPPKNFEERVKLLETYLFIIQKETEIAKMILQMEEEELAAILFLLED